MPGALGVPLSHDEVIKPKLEGEIKQGNGGIEKTSGEFREGREIDKVGKTSTRAGVQKKQGTRDSGENDGDGDLKGNETACMPGTR